MVVATLNDMVTEVLLKLQGYSMSPDRYASLASSMTATSTTATVSGNTDNGFKGVIEIGDELIYVSAFTAGITNTDYSPITRAHMGTVAAAYTSGTLVTLAPSFPRIEIKRAINDTILAVFPKVWGINSTNFDFKPAVNTYAIPSSVNTVLSVSYQTIGASKEWRPVRDWRVDPYADISTFGTPNTITLYSPITPGSTVRVTYAGGPDTLTNNFDDFADTTGFQESMRDVIILGACYRLMSTIDPALTQYTSPENQVQSSKLAAGSATNAAKYFYALFQQRLNEESEKLKNFYPVRVHFTR